MTSEGRPKATKTYLKEVQQSITALQNLLDADTTARLRSTDQPLEPGEERSKRYKQVVKNSPLTEEHRERYLKQLDERKAEESRVKKELGLS